MRITRRTARRAATAFIAMFGLSCSDRVTGPDGSTLKPGRASHSTTPAPAPLTWLSPLGNGNADPATFDATAVTRVEICLWINGSCSGLPIAVFATVPTPAEGALLVNTNAADYEATWSLMSTSFLTRKTYRIRALNGQSEVGAISVDVLRGRWALTRDDGTLAPLTAATSLPIKFFTPIIPGPAAALQLTTPALNALSGEAFGVQPVVTIVDAKGRVETGDNSTVILMTAVAPASGAGTVTATAQNGVATFANVGVTGANGSTATLVYSIQNSQGVQGTEQTIVVNTGRAAKLVLTTEAAEAFNGSPFTTQPALSVRDDAGNVKPNDFSTVVTMTVSQGATVVGTASKTSDHGTVVFDNVGIIGSDNVNYTLTFSAPNLTSATQGISAIATAYVSVNGSDFNPGTAAAPKRSISAGIAMGIARVHITTGTFTNSPWISLASGVSLYGGYSPATWAAGARSFSRNTVIVGTSQNILFTQPTMVGLHVIGVHIENVAILGTSDVGRSSYGVILVGSSGVEFSNTTIIGSQGNTVGTTFNGTDGFSGDRGDNGSTGNPDGPGAGNGGTAGSGAVCGSPGGTGGNGGAQGAHSGLAGAAGSGGPLPGAGGAGGLPGNPGHTGAAGVNGASGLAGHSGAGGNTIGTFEAPGETGVPAYLPGSGRDGDAGQVGSGGGGGGGGGGQTQTSIFDILVPGAGNGGGGGGSGGCSGGGGVGGFGGGGSFGLVLWESSVTFSNFSQIQTLNGGAGSSGGGRGIGGAGGAGGLGGARATNEIGAGGKGGNGGTGGAGGFGGGGGGGPSVGIVLLAGSSYTGSPGFSIGSGGAAGGSSQNAGSQGLATTVYTP